MSHLLPLDPQGIGTENVEALSSYFGRLAGIHGLNPFQFANYLRRWTGIMAFNRGYYGGFVGRAVLSANGFGKGAQAAVSWLEQGLGGDHFSAMTLMIFRDVLPAYGPGVMRRQRAWCPACVTEMRAAGVPVHEKLSWFVGTISRCHIHKISLEQVCPCCQRPQYDYLPTVVKIGCCRSCGEDLVSPASRWVRAVRPSIGESDLLEIIRFSSLNPAYRYDRNAPHIFVAAYRNRKIEEIGRKWCLKKAGILGTTFRKSHYQPAMETLLRISALTEVPLHLMLDSPDQAWRIAQLEPDLAHKVMAKPRAFRTKGKREQFRLTLLAVLNTAHNGVPPSLKSICKPFDISAATASYWFPQLSHQVVLQREVKLAELRETRLQVARRCVREEGIPRYRSGQLRSQDAVVDYLKAKFGISKCALRRELANQLSDDLRSESPFSLSS